jgi:signal transduction histidine kinase
MIVNGVIDEMETLIHSLAGVGNDIAHDLRTPLTRARLTLERGRTGAKTLEQPRMAADKTIEGIDQSLSIVTAISRLAETEKSKRSAGFGKVALADLLREVGDLYEPIAEDKGIALHIHSSHELSPRGDRDLLIEAVANLVDNAVKFTPAGGQVEIGLFRSNRENILRVGGTSRHQASVGLRMKAGDEVVIRARLVEDHGDVVVVRLDAPRGVSPVPVDRSNVLRKGRPKQLRGEAARSARQAHNL